MNLQIKDKNIESICFHTDENDKYLLFFENGELTRILPVNMVIEAQNTALSEKMNQMWEEAQKATIDVENND